MARIPTVNPNRTYTNKEIDLVSLLPTSMRETEVQTFLELFETYLNTMYEGATKYVPPENLEAIAYTDEMIWTNGYEYVTAPYGNLLDTFKAGDYIRRNNETKYYKIEQVVDNSTIKLTEKYIQTIPPSYFKSAYWDEFGEDAITDFWNPSSSASPVGMDNRVTNQYKLDMAYDRLICVSATSGGSYPTYSRIATEILGEYEMEFGFHRTTDASQRNNQFGFLLKPAYGNSGYLLTYANNGLSLQVTNVGGSTVASGYIAMDDDEDDWVVNVKRNPTSGTMTFKVSSLKNKSGTVPLGFTSAVGYFNRFEYEVSMVENASYNTALYFKNGLQQGFNYVYFESDSGFKGEVDKIGLESSLNELPESMYIYGTPMGRVFENDGNLNDIYQFYHNGGNLRIRNINSTPEFSATDFRRSLNVISILEKIRRLTELHDPDLIDMEYIQFFANYLGYNVSIDRGTMGVFLDPNSQLTDEESQEIIDKYIRNVIVNLPTWYKIKTTDNALAIMLYSFGIISDLNYYFCTSYGDNSTWVTEVSGTESKVTSRHYQTPHFSILINIDQSVAAYLSNPERMAAIIDGILSVKPINTVFRSLGVFFQRNLDMIYLSAIMTANQYMYLT